MAQRKKLKAQVDLESF